MNWRILKKISIAVIDVFKAFNHKSEPRLIMTLLVKDEEEMLEKNLIFHKSLCNFQQNSCFQKNSIPISVNP